jgi:hypothetical protein
MCAACACLTADNAVNGKPSCGNRWLLQDVLRDEWGHEGHVVCNTKLYLLENSSAALQYCIVLPLD